MIRILLVDDQMIVCDGLRVILDIHPNLEVIGMAHDGADGLRLAEKLKPDVILMDLKMPVMNGVQATQAIKKEFPEIAIVILTTYDEDEWVVDAVRAGANGYLLKDADREEIVAAIEGVMAGRTPLNPQVAEKLFGFVQRGVPQRDALKDVLTPREMEVLRLLATGLTNAGIASRLFLAEGTVRNHVTNLLGKLDVDDRAQATALAWRLGVVGLED